MKFFLSPIRPIALFFTALPFAASGNVLAQLSDQKIIYGPIEIVGKKNTTQFVQVTPVADKVLAAQRAATSDTAQLLKDIPGISLYGAGGISSLPAIHGMADDRVRIVVDGMGVMSACPNHMNSPLSYIDPSNVANIGVFAGITPVSAGGDSIGGTILVNSAPPEFAINQEEILMKGEAGTFYRSNGQGYGGNFSATYANEWFNFTYNGSIAQSKNYRAGRDFKPAGLAAPERGWLAGNEVGSSAYKAENNALGFAMLHDNHLLQFNASMQDVPYEWFPNQRMDMTENNNKQFNLRYQGEYQWGNLEARIFEQITHHQMQFGPDKQFRYGAAAGMPMDADANTKGLSLQAEIVLSTQDAIKLGTEILNYRLNDWWPASTSTVGMMGPGTFQNIHNGQRDRIGVFAEWDANWNPHWFTQFGIRTETVRMNTGAVQGYNTIPMYQNDAKAFNAANHQRTDNTIDVTALIRYLPSANQTVELGYAQKTRSPNLYERYTWSALTMASIMNNFAGDGNGYVGNLDLTPEVAHTVSATIDFHDADKKEWQVKSTSYYTYVTDYIDAQRCPISYSANCTVANLNATTGFVNLQYVNQTAQLYGVDVSGYLNLGNSREFGNFTANAVMNYTRGKNQSTGDNLYNIIPLNTKLAFVQRINSWINTAELQLVTAKTNISQVRNEVQTGGYALVNLRSSLSWKQARFDLGIENLFNRFYNLPLGGAYVGQGETMSLTGVPWGVPVPGMGRSIHAAVSVKF